jgi:hypothetical protein
MKRMIGFIVLLAAISVAHVGVAQAPAGAPAGATGQCNDGTYTTAANKSGACRGHKGIKTWFAAADTSKAKTSSAKTATTPTPAASPAPTPAATTAPSPAPATTPAPAAKASTKTSTKNMAQAPGGGAGLVWLNTESNVYHCQGTQFYGKTKAGSYMTEEAAKAKGAHPDHGKPCK